MDYRFAIMPAVTSLSLSLPPQAMQMVSVPSSTFGSFFDGDCYVVLAVSGSGQDGLNRKQSLLGIREETRGWGQC